MSYTRSKSAPARRAAATSTSRSAVTRSSARSGRRGAGDVEPVAFTTTTGSVFEAICQSPEQAENLRLRAELMMRIRRVMAERRLTQERAARLFGVTQPRISDLVRGKIDRFSIDTLVGMLGRAGLRVRVMVTQRAA